MAVTLTESFLESLVKIAPEASTVVEALKGLSTELTALEGKFSGLEKGSELWFKTKQKIEEVNSAINDQVGKLDGAAGASARALMSLQQATASVSRNITETFGSVGKGIAEATTKIIEGLKSALPAVLMTFTQLGRTALDPLKDGSELVTAMFGQRIGEANAALKQLLVTQNEARRILLASGDSMAESNQKAIEYTQTLRRLTLATGISAKTIHETNSALSIMGKDGFEVAGSGLSEFTNGMVESGLTLRTVALTMFRGLGVNAADATQKIKENFLSFGEGVEDTIRGTGDFEVAAKQTGHTTMLATDSIRDASKSLAIFGTGSTSAAKMWTTFASALEDVPIEQTNQMVRDLTGSIANMSIQNRAFISMMSGLNQGATALGGGLKMELMLREEGGAEKNFQSIIDSMKNLFGGQVITLKQAADNPQLQMLFQGQRQYLARFGITQNEQQNRVLEVMQGIEKGGISQVEGGKELGELFKKGDSMQKKEITFLEEIAKNTALLAGTADKPLAEVNSKLSSSADNLNKLAQSFKNTGVEAGEEFSTVGAKRVAKERGRGARELIEDTANILKNSGDRFVKGAAEITKRAEDTFTNATKRGDIKETTATKAEPPKSRNLEVPTSGPLNLEKEKKSGPLNLGAAGRQPIFSLPPTLTLKTDTSLKLDSMNAIRSDLSSTRNAILSTRNQPLSLERAKPETSAATTSAKPTSRQELVISFNTNGASDVDAAEAVSKVLKQNVNEIEKRISRSATGRSIA